MKTRFSITYKAYDGLEVLMRPNQARNFFDTKEEAEKYLKGIIENTSTDTLIQVFGKQSINTFRVKEIECWDNGDAVRTVLGEYEFSDIGNFI